MNKKQKSSRIISAILLVLIFSITGCKQDLTVTVNNVLSVSAPQNLKAEAFEGANILTWKFNPENISGYMVSRTKEGGEEEFISGAIFDTYYVDRVSDDNILENGVKYTYKVYTLNYLADRAITNATVTQKTTAPVASSSANVTANIPTKGNVLSSFRNSEVSAKITVDQNNSSQRYIRVSFPQSYIYSLKINGTIVSAENKTYYDIPYSGGQTHVYVAKTFGTDTNRYYKDSASLDVIFSPSEDLAIGKNDDEYLYLTWVGDVSKTYKVEYTASNNMGVESERRTVSGELTNDEHSNMIFIFNGGNILYYGSDVVRYTFYVTGKDSKGNTTEDVTYYVKPYYRTNYAYCEDFKAEIEGDNILVTARGYNLGNDNVKVYYKSAKGNSGFVKIKTDLSVNWDSYYGYCYDYKARFNPGDTDIYTVEIFIDANDYYSGSLYSNQATVYYYTSIDDISTRYNSSYDTVTVTLDGNVLKNAKLYYTTNYDYYNNSYYYDNSNISYYYNEVTLSTNNDITYTGTFSSDPSDRVYYLVGYVDGKYTLSGSVQTKQYESRSGLKEVEIMNYYGPSGSSKKFYVPSNYNYLSSAVGGYSDPTYDDYLFKGLYTDSSYDYSYNYYGDIYNDTTLYAKWGPEYPTITLMNYYGPGYSEKTYTVYSGNWLLDATDSNGYSYTAPTYTGYRFGGWYTDPYYNYSYSTSSSIEYNTTLYAKWIEIYEVTLVDYYGPGQGNKTVYIDSSNSYRYLSYAVDSYGDSYIEPSYSNYTFVGWYTDEEYLSSFSSYTNVNGSRILYARWRPDYPTIKLVGYNGPGAGYTTYTVSSGYSLSSAYNDYNGNYYTAPTYTGYVFDGWYTDEDYNYSFSTSSYIYYDTMLYAKWTRMYEVTLVDYYGPGQGNKTVYINPNSSYSYRYLSSAIDSDGYTYTNPTYTGYTFVNWYTDDEYNYSFSSYISNDIILYAKWNES